MSKLFSMAQFRRNLRNFFSNDAEQAWEKLRIEHGENDAITEHERTLISAALQLDTVTVDEVSEPRSEIISLSCMAGFEAVLAGFQTSRKSRLPIIGDDLDDVRGFLALKDVVAFIGNDTPFIMEDHMRPVTFLPENMTLDRALQQLKKNRMQVAIVVDEYGGTAGLVTLKNMLEELVGDIDDEDDDNDPVAPEMLTEKTYKLDPRWLMEDLRTQFNWPEPTDDDEDFETVGGYVLAMVGRIPDVGESIVGLNGATFKVSASNGRRILGLELHL